MDKLWSIEAEAAVIGSIILEPDCIGEVLPILGEGGFYKGEHQVIYDALMKLYTDNQPVDAIALRTELKANNQLDAIGGVKYIADILNSVPSAANVVYYAGVVRDRADYRELMKQVDQMGKVLNEPLNVQGLVGRIQEIALSLNSENISEEYFFMAERVAEIAGAGKEEHDLIKTGFWRIDYFIDGIMNGELIIIAGRPSMGKTALALQFAITMAMSGLSVVFFTLEMTYKSLIQRALRNNGIQDLQAVDIILHEGGQTPEKQIAFIKTRKKTHKVDVVFVDYLQLMTTGKKNESRNQEVSVISRKLKLAAVSEGVPIIALSQLNRAVESRENHRPRLSDLRESGSLEQDADIVMLLTREDFYRKNKDPQAMQDGSAELIIAKNRRGPTGIAELVFLDELAKFGDKAQDA